MWTAVHGGGPRDPERTALLEGTPTKRRSLCDLNTEPVNEDKRAGPIYPGGCQLAALFSEQESETQRGE